jgi:thioredoxin family protein
LGGSDIHVDATRFGTGLTYEAFKGTMSQNRERLEAAEAEIEIDPRDLEFFRSLRPLRCVALVEDWCGDVIANLPVLAVLAREVGPALELRCFIKADVPDLATRYLNHGRFESLPVFAFFDEAGNDVGAFIERPVAVTERREADRRAVYASNPAFGSPDAPASELPDDVRVELMAGIQAKRTASTPWANRQVVIAIRDAIARAPQVGERVPHTR